MCGSARYYLVHKYIEFSIHILKFNVLLKLWRTEKKTEDTINDGQFRDTDSTGHNTQNHDKQSVKPQDTKPRQTKRKTTRQKN